MKIELKKIQVEGRKVWQWWVKRGRTILAGGMCATKKDAANDAGVWMRLNAEVSHGGTPLAPLTGSHSESNDPRTK